jgi:DNA-cytosine methyltransferase
MISAPKSNGAERDAQDAKQANRQYTVAELFCGCGGLSHGFARSGYFRVVLGNDIKKAALRTFFHNHSRSQAAPECLQGDIRTISIREIEEALARQNVPAGKLDCLIGGPPCQGFSQMRRSEERLADGLMRFKGYNKLDQDPRNDLVLRFLEIANALRPKIVLIENVPQMLRHGHNGVLGGLAASVKSMLQEMGYAIVVGVINSAERSAAVKRAIVLSRLPYWRYRISGSDSCEPGGDRTYRLGIIAVEHGAGRTQRLARLRSRKGNDGGRGA